MHWRTTIPLAVIACLAAGPLPCRGQETGKADLGPQALTADVASIDAIIAALYDVVSGPAGVRDWERFRSLFVPDARLILVARDRDGNVRQRVMDAEGYIAAAGAYFQENGFFEREIARKAERFGHIAHVFSTYESRHVAEDPEPFSRGINSFQLMNDRQRWWIVTIYWEAESPDNPIPQKYLPRP